MTTNNASANVVDEHQKLVTFHNDYNPVVHEYDVVKDIPRNLLSVTQDGDNHSLLSFLERPKRLSTFLWNSTDAVDSIIASVQVPFDLLNNAVQYQKINGFYGFRGTAVIKIQCNPTRFQQGRLLGSFFPLGGKDGESYKYNNTKGKAIYCTQRPKVEFDPSVDTEVTLKIPYVTDNLFYDLVDGTGGAGIFDITVYSAFSNPGGAASTDISIWGYFEKPELVFANFPSTLFPQSGEIPKAKSKKGRQRQQDPSDVEQKQMGVGPVSSFLGSVASTATIAKNIPLLSSVAGPVSWAASIGAKIAHAFGFSNPMNNVPVTRVIQNPCMNAINSTGADNSQNFGLFEDNKVEILPGFAGNDLDEMTIAYPISIPTYFQRFNWTTSTAAGALLSQIAVGISHTTSGGAQTILGTPAIQVTDTTPIAYFNNLFQYYRGSIKYTFKVVKTEFHTGRLMVCLSMGADNSIVSYANTSYAHREIIDLRDSTEFTITVPYAQMYPWTVTGIAYAYISVFCMNQLQAPSTVSSSVEVLVEECACEDFEYSVPKQMTWQACFPTNPAATGGPNDLLIAQGGDITHAEMTASAHQPKVSKPIGSTSIIDDANVSTRYCIGEKITSFRQLLKRTLPCYMHNFGTAVSGLVGSVWFDPWSVVVPGSAGIPTGLGAPGLYAINDYLDYIAPCYAFMRGSMRIKRNTCFGSDSIQDLKFLSVKMYEEPSGVSTFGGDVSTNNNVITNATAWPIVPFLKDYNTNMEVQVPYYSQRHVNAVIAMPPVAWNQNATRHPRPRLNILEQVILPTTTSTIIYSRQIGEDFSLGYWTGTLPITPIAAPVRMFRDIVW